MRQLKINKQITRREEASISRYFLELNRYPMISAEEEVVLARRIREGDEEALEKLVLANLRFVISVAKQYQDRGLSLPDLINEGNLGLVRAARRFDETRGFKFISYAVWWIRQSMIQAISNHTRIVRLPINQLSRISKIQKAIPQLEQTFEREPTQEEIAGFLDLTDAEVNQSHHIQKRQVSLDSPITNESDNDFSLYDVIQKENLPSPDNGLLRESDEINIHRVLSKLSERESGIITRSFGLYGEKVHSLHDLAMEYQMTSERVRQIRSTALGKMKSLLRGNDTFLEF
ncbi:MAG: RNA polymerase sigma factor RpoD/SigA [Bacteroidales bacterium]|nr:RNA polymerase sigma factor RpoD/SigA [Bacteroidales bacterium]